MRRLRAVEPNAKSADANYLFIKRFSIVVVFLLIIVAAYGVLYQNPQVGAPGRNSQTEITLCALGGVCAFGKISHIEVIVCAGQVGSNRTDTTSGPTTTTVTLPSSISTWGGGTNESYWLYITNDVCHGPVWVANNVWSNTTAQPRS